MISLRAMYRVCLLSLAMAMVAGRQMRLCNAGVITVSACAFRMPGQWWWFQVKFLLPAVCVTSEIAKGLCAGARIQSLFLAVIGVGLTGSDRGFQHPSTVCTGPSVVFSTRNKLQRAC